MSHLMRWDLWSIHSVYIYSQSPRNDHQLPAKCSQIRGQQLIAMWELGQLLFQWFSFFSNCLNWIAWQSESRIQTFPLWLILVRFHTLFIILLIRCKAGNKSLFFLLLFFIFIIRPHPLILIKLRVDFISPLSPRGETAIKKLLRSESTSTLWSMDTVSCVVSGIKGYVGKISAQQHVIMSSFWSMPG